MLSTRALAGGGTEEGCGGTISVSSGIEAGPVRHVRLIGLVWLDDEEWRTGDCDCGVTEYAPVARNNNWKPTRSKKREARPGVMGSIGSFLEQRAYECLFTDERARPTPPNSVGRFSLRGLSNAPRLVP